MLNFFAKLFNKISQRILVGPQNCWSLKSLRARRDEKCLKIHKNMNIFEY